MEALLSKLQNDVAARKRPRSEVIPRARTGVLLLATFFVALEIGARSADSSAGLLASFEARERIERLTGELEASRGEIAIQRARLERLEKAYEYSARYGIGADLAVLIEETARAEGIDPQLAFDLVRVESGFDTRAVSPVGALGLTQMMPATAELLLPGITRSQILEPETNLRLGFRFYNYLLRYYRGDVRLALLAYNRGPGTVDRLLAAGIDPANGYASAVLSQSRSTTLD